MRRGFASNYRPVLLAVIVGACFVGFGVRLVDLHVLERNRYLSLVTAARKTIIVEKARRGDVLDARGAKLATSKSQVVLGVDPQSVDSKDEAKWGELARLLDMKESDVRRIFTTKTRSSADSSKAVLDPATGAIRFQFKLTDSKGAKTAEIDELLEEEEESNGDRLIKWAKLKEDLDESVYEQVKALKIKGVYGNRVYRRAYPQNALASHVIGYVNDENVPAAGIERYADFYLRGQDGWRESERDGKRRELAQFQTREVDPVNGYHVQLSIDAAVQHMVEEELAVIARTFKPQKATIIVSDAQTGFLLAMGNYPSFNLNEYGKADIASMRNIAVTDVLEPGSTFKIVAAAGALDRNLVSPQDRFDCSLQKIDYLGKPRDLPREDHRFVEPLSVREILSHSSNKGAVQLAMRLGNEDFYRYAKNFGFGGLTGFPIGGEVQGTVWHPSKWDGKTITRMPMGHAVDATPLQIHYAMGVIASGGELLRPQVIREIRDAGGETVFRYDRAAVRRVIQPRSAEQMASMLKWVTIKDEGTAPEAAIPGFEVAGKTGTTQKIIERQYSNKHHIGSFVGFFPASRPAVVISVIVDDGRQPNGGLGYGKAVAAPSFKRIGEQLIQYLNIRPVVEVNRPGLLAMEGWKR